MTVSTSLNNPLNVAWIHDPALTTLWAGRLGLTIAPGKKGTMLGRSHNRDLNADFARLTAERVNTVVNMMEAHEEARWQMHGYDEAAQRAGLNVRHFPVVDVNVPSDPAAFAALVEEIYAQLQEGETVVAHCLGGLGRSGMLVACLLVRSGEFGADDAIRFVRKKRDIRAIEGEQPQFVEQYFQNLDR